MANVQRRYVDTRFGQSHVYQASPASTTSRPPLMCFHMSPWAAVVFEPLLQAMGNDRMTLAVDTPGYGNSDAPPAQPTIEDYAASMGDVMDRMNLRRVDLLGERTGAKIALELARQRPDQVGKLVLISPVVWNDSERGGRKVYPPEKIHADGSHLKTYWNISTSLSMPGRTLDMIGRVFPSRLLQNNIAHWGRRAAAQYDAVAALKGLDKPVLVVRPKDELWALVERIRPHLTHPESQFVDRTDWGLGFVDVKPKETAALLRSFLG